MQIKKLQQKWIIEEGVCPCIAVRRRKKNRSMNWKMNEKVSKNVSVQCQSEYFLRCYLVTPCLEVN